MSVILVNRQAPGINKPPIYKIFFVQMTVILIICAGYYWLYGNVAAYSSLIGGLIFVIPQLYFGFKAFLYSGARSIQKIVVNFYKGESSKILIIALSFALIFKFVKPLDYLALYSTFFSVLILNCFSPLLLEKAGKNKD